MSRQQPPEDSGLHRERGEITLSIASPTQLVDESEGIAAALDTEGLQITLIDGTEVRP
jgi:hypothetical protein